MADETTTTVEATTNADTVAQQTQPTAQTPGTEAKATAPAQDLPEMPSYSDVKYYSQLDKDTAGNKEIMEKVKGYKTVSELAKAYAESSKRNENALFIPTKESTPEEVKGFFTRLGVPEDSNGYELQDGDYKPEQVAELKDYFKREVLYHNGLTKQQGERVWNACLNAIINERRNNEAAFEKMKADFNTNHDNLLKAEFPVDADRKAAMSEDLDLASEFFVESGLGETFKKTGLVYNPEVVHKLAQYHKATRAKGVLGTTKETPAGTGLFPQGGQFKAAFKR